MKKLTIVLCLLTLCSCAARNEAISQSLSSGVVGCHPKEIKITNSHSPTAGIQNWTAECKGEIYICSYHSSSGVNCK
jgi:hypothetical protein